MSFSDPTNFAAGVSPRSVAVGDFNGDPKPDLAANFGSNDVSELLNDTNRAPVATGDSYTTDEDTPLNVDSSKGVLSNDTDPDGDALSAAVVSGPSWGDLTLNEDGSFSYTPDPNYISGDPVGPFGESFTYKVSDGKADSNTAHGEHHRRSG